MPVAPIIHGRARDRNTGRIVDDINAIRTKDPTKIFKKFKKQKEVEFTMTVNAIEKKAEAKSWEETEMSPQDASLYRAIVARCIFLAIDKPEIMYASKECSGNMAKPENGDWEAIKSLGR